MPSSLKKVAVGRMMFMKGRSEEGGVRSGGAPRQIEKRRKFRKSTVQVSIPLLHKPYASRPLEKGRAKGAG